MSGLSNETAVSLLYPDMFAKSSYNHAKAVILNGSFFYK
jgi:hypothetical protein